ncbi:alpha/beta fold hydrolase [Rehaibacterium terrae]|jgi:alpha/beta superfamily hydrolase|uniref:Alpha/beta superfamily hydrolase n=1 Tax=Rehaibacterium terrae TaxID=1341696 RepID=A0A7W7V6X3_9GAMM|nr:alpha/beta fold hydrolase [Rehaibacterium terrae]MBB5014267.1 alpha/beta superfamily hydrolase [Rehaibacterium terrae]
MKGHVILSHGLNSGPEATKVAALAAVADGLGWTHERPDYTAIDARGRVEDIDDRLALLRAHAEAAPRPLVLAGSSMGAFISCLLSREMPVAGLFLMAPPIGIEGYRRRFDAAAVPTAIVHGWDDELIPAMDVVRWARARRDRLVLVDDSHRLANHVDFVAEEFGRFLQRL